MKLAVARVADSEDPVLMEIDNDKATVIEGARPADLLAVALAPQDWPGRIGQPWDIVDVRFMAPIARPGSLRDFMAYDAHVINSLSALGQKPSPEWYEQPVFYFSNPAAILGDGDGVRRPRGSARVDYEVELAAIVGREVSDVDAEDPHALACLAGFTLMNDWSARDIAAQEMKHFLGPAKGKDFATSLGPWVVTPDELDIDASGRVNEPALSYVNGQIYTDNTFYDMTFPWPKIIERASANTTLLPGDVIGSGTVGFGCILELRTRDKVKYPFLADGDVIELSSPKLGVLRNTIIPCR
jgi:2-keto-4-pentenoate hydratase/2-oxohepta-3-ene-1,7-dioic acid hydratase in catechol pathway